jgi:hypothetical protein
VEIIKLNLKPKGVVLSKELRLFQLKAMDLKSIMGIVGVALLTWILFFTNLPYRVKDLICVLVDLFLTFFKLEE